MTLGVKILWPLCLAGYHFAIHIFVVHIYVQTAINTDINLLFITCSLLEPSSADIDNIVPHFSLIPKTISGKLLYVANTSLIMIRRSAQTTDPRRQTCKAHILVHRLLFFGF